MVRALMDELERQSEDEELDATALGPLAVKLAAAVLKEDLLLVGGKAWEVERTEPRAVSPGSGELFHVLTKPGSSLNQCSWCRRTYRSSDVSSPYRLCPSCWNEGPTKEDLA